MIELQPNQRVLDVCAGTNAIGIALLKREPTLEIHAIDRSTAMQEVGRQRAEHLGFHINSVIADVHTLPFPDNHFDVVTLQLRLCLSGTGFFFRSSPAALNLIKYFINALEIFYSTEELTVLLEEQGYCDISAKAIFSGMLGCHRARKPLHETTSH